jgi:hypothetical protein
MKNSGPVPAARWGGGTLREARRMLAMTLEGVGTGETVERMMKVALHHRRSLNPKELATLSAEWLAIPAVDQFSDTE